MTPRRWDPSVLVRAPRDEVFAYFADPRNRPEWQGSLARVELLSADGSPGDGEPHVGMRWVDHVKVGPPFTLQISGLEQGTLWSEVGSAGPFTAFGTLLFSDEGGVEGGATRVRCVARVRGRGPAVPFGIPATLLGMALVRGDLRRAKRVLEAR